MIFTKGFAIGIIVLISLSACSNSSGKGESNNPPSNTPTVRQPENAPLAIGISLSAEAQEVSDLIDKNNWESARQVLYGYLRNKKNDAGLYCQYLRYLLSYHDILDLEVKDTPLEVPPLDRGDGFSGIRYYYRISDLTETTAKTAVQLAPQTKSWVADTIFRETYERIKERADKGLGYLPDSYFPEEEVLRTQILWTAIEISPDAAKRWANQYAELVSIFNNSKATRSATWTANIVGDMRTNSNGDSDFIGATKALREGLEMLKPDGGDPDPRNAIRLYLSAFAKDAERFYRSGDPEYKDLILQVKRWKYFDIDMPGNFPDPPNSEKEIEDSIIGQSLRNSSWTFSSREPRKIQIVSTSIRGQVAEKTTRIETCNEGSPVGEGWSGTVKILFEYYPAASKWVVKSIDNIDFGKSGSESQNAFCAKYFAGKSKSVVELPPKL